MVPRIAENGRSFRGAGLYYLRDKDAETSERVAWTHTENMITSDPEKAVKVMAYTALHQRELKEAANVPLTGRKLEKPVFTFSIAWNPEEQPDPDHMLETAKSAVKHLCLDEHEVLYVAHRDEPQPHVHVILNRVNPTTGIAAPLSKTKELLSDWAYDYEKRNGKIYCQERVSSVKNRQDWRAERAKGNKKAKAPKFCDPVIKNAWKNSDSGRAFVAALAEHGYRLAQGKRRLVVIDQWGKTHNPVRVLEGVKAKDFKARMADLDPEQLPRAEALQKEIKSAQRKAYHQDRQQVTHSAQTLNQMQDRHLEERAALNEKFDRRIDREKRELGEFYRCKDVEDEIARLKAEGFRDPPLLHRLTGKAAKDTRRRQERIADLEAQQKDAQRRIEERLGAIELKSDQAVNELALRQEKEREKLVRDAPIPVLARIGEI